MWCTEVPSFRDLNISADSWRVSLSSHNLKSSSRINYISSGKIACRPINARDKSTLQPQYEDPVDLHGLGVKLKDGIFQIACISALLTAYFEAIRQAIAWGDEGNVDAPRKTKIPKTSQDV
ncbi:hypothetical protein LTR78_002916 [Recurvomyces mirabilis]|uniref:Uncharacterized protein n=1 Tax=Recurvomyces mirabilis TaxID=574656 RepID=A0AAE1C4D7_9PEZI|nr:hypothetical protein LTR78_002916 [Recurvomyces mirabilis]KAK5159350.1 hypothetical protein LTS14_002492 [Recurvomyces mirabilis]